MSLIDDKNNYEWLSELCDIQSQEWYSNKVLRPSDIKHYKFYKSEAKSYRCFINPSDIVGIEYAYSYNCFNEINWLDLINNLKRFERIRRNINTHNGLLEHSLNDYNENKTVAKYGNQYITIAGQHRLALCKFLGVKSVEVDVLEYPFNCVAYINYLRWKSFLDFLLNEKLIITDVYNQALNSDSKHTSICIKEKYFRINSDCFNAFINCYKSLSINKFSIFLSLLNQLIFGKLSTHNNSIETNKDIHNIKNFLRLIKSGYIN